MSYSNDCMTMTMPVEPAYSSNRSNDGNGMWGDNGAWWIVLFLIFAAFGWGGFGNGFGGGFGGGSGGGGATPYYTNAATQADIQRGFDNQGVMNKLNGIEQGICSLGYDQLNQMNGINANVMSGFGRLDTSLCQLGNNITQSINGTNVALMQGQNALATQLADCCCKTQTAIQANTTQGVMNTNAIQGQIQQCCCDNEKLAMTAQYNAQAQNNATLIAIDKLGDRLEARLTAQEMAAKDETISALRQQLNDCARDNAIAAQSTYLTNTLRPCPVPSYLTCNPWSNQAPYGSCGCNNGCGC